MWCGGCYTSSPKHEFYIKTLNVDATQEESATREILQEAWGNRHRPTSDYKQARDGDHLMVPFNCDLCVYRKLKGGLSPKPESIQDELLLACIRRVNLDAFWSRATSTVRSNKDRIKSGLSLSLTLGLQGPYSFYGTTDEIDSSGFEVAIQMVMASRKAGKYSSEYTQWETIRKIRSSHATFSRCTPQGSREVLALSDEKGQIERFVQDGTASYWFARFFIGCKRRMGQEWKPNRALSTDQVTEVLKEVEERIKASETEEEINKWVVFSAYVAITYVLSLRGSEGFLLDLGSLKKHWRDGWPEYLVIGLLGKVKGEANERTHLLPCISETGSGIQVRNIVQRLFDLKTLQQELSDGPAISDRNGRVYSTVVMDTCLLEVLESVFEKKKRVVSHDN